MAPEPRVVHSDEWLAVIDKPAGLVVHPAPGTSEPTLVDLLGDLLGGGGDPTRPGIVHRLDRDTSGLMLVARTEGAHSALSRAIAAREVTRVYQALIEGRPRSRTGTIDAPLGRDFRAPERRAVGGRASRDAVTHFEVIQTLRGFALAEIRLETGRTHQIRAHFQAIGHPLAGDTRYGGHLLPGLDRQFLHSTRLAFAHPGDGEAREFSSPLPPDLAAVLTRLDAE